MDVDIEGGELVRDVNESWHADKEIDDGGGDVRDAGRQSRLHKAQTARQRRHSHHNLQGRDG